jgi:hypothetical protein
MSALRCRARQTGLLVVLVAGATASACRRPIYDDERPARFAARPARIAVSARIVERFGESRPADADTTIGDRPTVFRYVRAIAEGNDGSMYVVDNQTKRVVRFGTDGTARVVIAGGYGVTPGRFVNPYAMVVDDRSRLFVLDSQLRRVTVFDASGQVKTTIPIIEPDPFGLAVRDSLVWVLRYFKADAPDAVSIYTMTGQRVATAFAVTPREKTFADSYTGVLATTSRGTVLFGHTTPGTWSAMDPLGHVERLGSEALPTSETRLEQTGRRMYEVHCPGGTIAIGAVGDDTIGVVYTTQFKEPPDRGFIHRTEAGPLVMNYFLDLFTAHGEYLGTTHLLPGLHITTATFSRQSHSLLVGVREPYPRVLKLAIDTRPVASRAGAQP